MRRTMLMAMLTVGAICLGPAVALATSQTTWGSGNTMMMDYRTIQGRVITMDPSAISIQVRGMEDTGRGSVRLGITDQTAVRQGMERRSLAAVQVGEEVFVRYDRKGDRWVADNINILEPLVARAPYLGDDQRSSHS